MTEVNQGVEITNEPESILGGGGGNTAITTEGSIEIATEGGTSIATEA